MVGPHAGLGSATVKPGISEGQGRENAEDTLQTTSVVVNVHSCEEESAGGKCGYQRSYPTDHTPFQKQKGKFIWWFKILLNLYDIIHWLNTVMKCQCHFHEGFVQLACPEKRDSSISQSLRNFHIYIKKVYSILYIHTIYYIYNMHIIYNMHM